MSTYTDLHNKLKETINVDYRSRDTNQEVHLKNERNEYWGSFNGRLDVKNSTISKAQLSDITLNGDILVNGRFIGGGLSIDINEVMDTISDLSTQLYQDDDVTSDYGDIVQHRKHLSELDEKTIALDKKIDELKLSSSGDLSVVSAHIVYQISSVSSLLSSQDDKLSGAIIDEMNDRKDNDTLIRLALDGESNTRKLADQEISGLVLSVDAQSKLRDLQLETTLEEHAKGNAQQFKDLEAEMLSTVAHDKHYAILDSEEMFKSYPYELQDFAVNVLNTTVKDGIVITDASIPVASVVRGEPTEAGESTYVVTFYDSLEDVHLLQAVWPGSQFILVDGVARPTHKNDYTISYSTTTNEIRLIANSKPYLGLHHALDNRLIGKIKNFLSSSEDATIISGSLYVDAGRDSALSVFNKFTDRIFNDTTSSLIADETEEIQFNRNEKQFIFRKGVYDKHYCSIKDASEQGIVFGRIYEGDVIDESSQLKSIKVAIDGQEVLLSAPTFCTDYKTELSDYALCCNVESHIFEKREKHAHYQYGYWDNGESPERRGHVVLTAENRYLMPLDFQEISVTIENTELTSLAGRTFTLNQVDPESFSLNPLWKTTIHEIEHDLDLELLFNGYAVQLLGTIEGQQCNFKWKVEINDVSIANADAYSKLVNKSSYVDWDSYPEVVPGCIASYEVNYQIPSRREDFDNVICQVSSDGLSSVDFIVPTKPAGSDISREFILAVNVASLNPTVGLNVNGSSIYDPVKVQFNGNDKIEISSNATMLLQFNEISSHSFIVTDLENNFEHDKINDIYRDLGIKSQQISALSADLNKLSGEHSSDIKFLSDEISSLSDQLSSISSYILEDIIEPLSNAVAMSADAMSTLVGDLSADLCADIDFLSATTKFLLSTDREHVAYQGTMSKYVPEDQGLTADYYLSAFINQSLNPDFKGRLKLGFMFRLSAEQKDLVDANREKIWFGANDYFIINKDVMVANILTSDIDIIRDAQGEFTYLSNQITSQISATSAFLSAADKYLSGQLSTTITDVGEISTAVALSAESICACIELSVNRLQSQIVSNDNDIANLQEQVASAQISVDNLSTLVSELSNGLSTETSALSEHYGRTFEKDVPIEITGKTISADLLKLTDENKNGKQYTLHLSAGTLVLIPIK